MSRGTYEYVTRLEYEYVWMSHVTYGCVMSRTNATWQMLMGHVTYECVMEYKNKSFFGQYVVSHKDESGDMYGVATVSRID